MVDERERVGWVGMLGGKTLTFYAVIWMARHSMKAAATNNSPTLSSHQTKQRKENFSFYLIEFNEELVDELNEME